eukprot:4613916-Pyramimonas_sp.AAC.1
MTLSTRTLQRLLPSHSRTQTLWCVSAHTRPFATMVDTSLRSVLAVVNTSVSLVGTGHLVIWRGRPR